MLWALIACAASWTPVDAPAGDSPPAVEPVGPVHCGEIDVEGEEDCDDMHLDIGPACPEVCDEVDNNCDGQIDEGLAFSWYQDADGDGWGDPKVDVVSCPPGTGWAFYAGDCNDEDAAVHPQADEVCNGLDDDCDGLVDPDAAVDATRWYPDLDADGYGDDSEPFPACVAPEGYIAQPGDCDDTDAAVNPEATEVPGDTTDEDCDGVLG